MRSYNTRAFISCETYGFRFLCNSTTNASRGVSLKEITFINTSLYLVDCSLKMNDCGFINNSVAALSLSFAWNSIENVQLDGCTFQNNSGGSLNIYGSSINLDISNTSFALHSVEEAILVMSTPNLQEQKSKVTVNFTNMTVSQNNCPGQACFELVAGVNGTKLALAVEGGFYENNVAGGSIFDVHGFSNPSVELKSVHFRKNTGRAVKIYNGYSLELKLVKAMFSENKIHHWDGGAVFVGGFTKEAFVSVFGSNFSSNRARNGGACAFFSISSLILDIENCQFVRNEAWSSGGAVAVGRNYKWLDKAAIDVGGSNFSGNILDLVQYMRNNSTSTHFDYWSADKGGGGALALYVLEIGRLSLSNNIFADNQAKGKNSGAVRAQLGTLHTDVKFLNCEFLRNSGGQKSGTLQLTVIYPSFQPRVILQNLTFIENSGDSLYDIYLFQNRLQMRSCKIQKNSGGGLFYGAYPNTLDLFMENTLISENTNFSSNIYEGHFSNGSVYQFKNVSFVNNTCNIKGSIFRIFMYPSQSLFNLQRSRFLDNVCKSGVVEISVKHSLVYNNSRVIINNTEFRGNSGASESTLTILDVSVITIQNSNFSTNFGSTDGSHVRVQMRSSQLTIHKTTFYQSKQSKVFNMARDQPYNGFLTVTSFGNITIRDSSFISDAFSAEGKVLIFVKGAREVVMDDSVQIKAPFSTKLNLHNFTHLEMETKLLKLSPSLITSFSLSTEPCPMETYSIYRGSSKGFALEDRVKCYACPNGGNCSSSLSARPNFWGYPIGDKVHFKLCPEGYCCPIFNQKCPYHNSSYLLSGCQGNRTGILCGQCKKDFSEGLFTTQCLPVRDCNQRWTFVILIIFTTLFALYLIRKPPVYETLMKNLIWFLPSHKKDDYKDYCSLDGDNKTTACSNYAVLKILFYFYQVAGVLTASSYGVRNLLKDSIVLPVTSLLDFQITGNNDWKICPLPGITPLSKTMFQLAAVTAIYFSIPVIYLLHSGLNKLSRRNSTLPPGGPYLGAVLEIVLLGYSATTGTAIKLLKCVRIQHVSRWYYDAQITCLQWWQSAAFLVIALYLLPFIFTLYFASLRLYQREISGKTFLLACVFPFPYLLFVFIVYVNKVTAQRLNWQEMISTTSAVSHGDVDTNLPSTIEHSLLEVVSGPFSKPQDHQSSGRIYWESILIGRRFVIILIGSFLEHAFLRSVCLTILCLVFLLHHIYQKPFAQSRANVVETVSLATLVVIAILNVGVASYYSAGIEAHGVNQQYVRFFLLTEALLLGVVPFVFALFVSLSLVLQFVRLAIVLFQAIRARWPGRRPKYNTQLSLLNQEEPLLPAA